MSSLSFKYKVGKIHGQKYFITTSEWISYMILWDCWQNWFQHDIKPLFAKDEPWTDLSILLTRINKGQTHPPWPGYFLTWPNEIFYDPKKIGIFGGNFPDSDVADLTWLILALKNWPDPGQKFLPRTHHYSLQVIILNKQTICIKFKKLVVITQYFLLFPEIVSYLRQNQFSSLDWRIAKATWLRTKI